MKTIFEAMQRIEATTIVEVNSDELFLIIEALKLMRSDWCVNGEDESEIDVLVERLQPLLDQVNEPHIMNHFINHHRDAVVNESLRDAGIFVPKD